MVCKNCGERIRTAPRHRSNDVVYDASVKSLVVYLSVVQFLPYGRIANFLHDVLGLSPSEGSLVNWVNEAKRNAQPIVDKIKEYIMSSNVVGFDESGCYCNKRLDWAWIAQTVYYTLLFRANGRGSKELTDRFGDSLERMTAVTDRHSAYFTMNVKGHQICIPHLLRNLNYLNELDKNQNWSSRLQELLKKAVHWRNTNPETIADTSTWMESLDKLLNENLDKFKKPFRQIRNSLRKLKDHVFYFLKDPRVPSHNNASEGGIRILKVKQKRSGGFRSQAGAEDFMAIHSVADTAKKNDFSRWDAILVLV